MSVRLNQASDTEGTLPLLEQITLSEFVSQLIQLSDQDRDELQQHSAEECEAEVNRLVQLVQDPSRGTLTVQETVGRLFMLQHRQADLEIKALRAEIKTLNRSNERLNSEVQDLRHDLKRAPDALEEHTSKPDESELSQAAATSSLSPRTFPGAPCLQAREEKRRSGLLSPLSFPREGGNKRSILRPHPHFMEIAACPVAVEGGGRDASRYESASPPRRKTDMRRRDSTSPYRSGSSVSRRDSASRSRSRADIYRDGYQDRREATPSQPRRNAYDVHARTRTTWSEGESSSSESDYEFHKPRSWGSRHGPRLKHLDSIAKDIEQFDPEKQDHNVEDYLRELERCLSDLPNATRQERVKLIWKTSSRSVRAFIHSQPLIVRESFSQLSRALIEEFSPFANETSATISALQIRHRRSEAPKEFYNSVKGGWKGGQNKPQGGDIHHLTGGEKGDNGYFSHQEKNAGGSFHS
ncbi:hypothetical protein SKAU_G00197490 [Synaphobranchus kaupii]|uniref:Uncharacterized protein n=1 Tax=Synaphobranchus kaupii TaxID=118154 RepID=A0A9Q1FEU0_SYNKA|nr:hypothetical protein SKAU_G00197490 [Synaphobranchus kaupii]